MLGWARLSYQAWKFFIQIGPNLNIFLGFYASNSKSSAKTGTFMTLNCVVLEFDVTYIWLKFKFTFLVHLMVPN